MDRRHFLGALGTALVTSLAGCTFALDAGSPIAAPATQDVGVTFTNASTRSLVFTAAAIPSGFGGVRIDYRDGTNRTLAGAEALDDVPSEAWGGAVTFYPLAADAERRRYDLAVGTGVGVAFDDLPLGTTVVTTVSDPGRKRSLMSATAGTCGQAETGSVDIVVDRTGSVSAHSTCVDDRSE